MKNLVMLEDFVFLVTEAVPQLLTDRQRSLLLLALRAKVNAGGVQLAGRSLSGDLGEDSKFYWTSYRLSKTFRLLSRRLIGLRFSPPGSEVKSL